MNEITTVDEAHLDPKNWTKATILRHLLFEHDRHMYYSSRDTKADFCEWHDHCHQDDLP